MKTILVVDDEEQFRDKYKKLFTSAGYDVIEAPDALEVANVLMRDHSRLDLILLDINLPEVDGRGIFEIIDEYDPNLKIMVTSVHPLSDQKLKIPRAADYFNKSQPDRELLEKINDLIGTSMASNMTGLSDL